MKRSLKACAAVVGDTFRCQIHLVQLCQNQGTAQVGGIWLCGTHVNAIHERPQRIITEVEVEP
jgi:hypothetical protein